MKLIRPCRTGFAVAALAALLCGSAAADELVQLPEPAKEGGMPLMEALANRKSIRTYQSKPIPPETLSNLLWAAWGVNRPDGRRTAPSTRNLQCVEIYVVLEEGLFAYDAEEHALRRVLDEDVREKTGPPRFTEHAPLHLVYVADFDRLEPLREEVREVYAWADTSFISQNVYLFCASEGLATVVRSVRPDPLAEALGLPENKRPILAQTIGFPVEEEE